MIDKDLIVFLMRKHKVSQQLMSERGQIGSQTNISTMLKSSSLRVSVFAHMLDILGYDLLVRERGRGDKPVYKITYTKRSLSTHRGGFKATSSPTSRNTPKSTKNDTSKQSKN